MTGATTDISWIDKDTGYPCVMLRNPWAGHLCGYVLVPAGHPVNGVPYDNVVGVEVHGGLTYSEPANSLGGMSSEWALGFDCGHLCDKAAPKDEDYVRAQLTQLAHQLKEITVEQVTAHYSAAVAKVAPYDKEATLSAIDAAFMLGERMEDPQERQTFELALRVAHAETELGNFEHAMKVVLKAVSRITDRSKDGLA